MTIVCFIVSGLALVAAVAAVCIAVMEGKRNQKRNAAAVELISRIGKDVEKLRDGVVPNYEQARAAANAVNDFNKGISAILGFDPFVAYQKEKQKERNGGEAE